MEDFEQYLMTKYPSLFYHNEKGEIQSPSCGIWCPTGWERLIEDLCEAIVQYTKHTYRTKSVPTKRVRFYTLKGFVAALRWSHSKLIKIYNKAPLNSRIGKIEHKARSLMFKFSTIEKVYAPTITIDQIKEKFGTLRFYYSGGDAKIDGIVTFAEHLSSVTCEQTGERGSMHKRGYWYKTLSDKQAEPLGYAKNTQDA